jgi:hypothetical protein
MAEETVADRASTTKRVRMSIQHRAISRPWTAGMNWPTVNIARAMTRTVRLTARWLALQKDLSLPYSVTEPPTAPPHDAITMMALPTGGRLG